MTTNITNAGYPKPTYNKPEGPAKKETQETANAATPAPSTPNTPPATAGSSGNNSVTFQTNAEHQQQNTLFLLERMFGDQARVSQRSSQRGEDSPFVRGSIAEYLSTLTVEQAQDYVAEDGFWGVERTAERLFDMAYSLAGGDPDKMEEMRDAVKRGFEAAERAWGSDLPEISGQTLDRAMEMFDKWFAEREANQ